MLDEPMSLRSIAAGLRSDPDGRRYYADPALIRLVKESTAQSGETDTANWMTGVEQPR